MIPRLFAFQRSTSLQFLKDCQEEKGWLRERLVGVPGIGPGTSSLSGTRSNQLSYTPILGGGGSRDRTGDIQLAKLALYRLSYAPLSGFRPGGTGDLPRGNFHAPLKAFTFAETNRLLLRKEVIQPLVPQRLPCYDFIPITTHTLGGSLRLRVQTAFMM